MVYIYMLTEIDDSGIPIYRDEFLEKSKQNCTILTTSEYATFLEYENKNVVVVPDEIMQDYDKNLDAKGKRFVMMEVYRNEKFENWLSFVFKENNERVEGIVIKYAYASVIHVATENRKSVLVEQNRKEMSMNSEEEYQKLVSELKRQIEILQTELKQKEVTTLSLSENLNSSSHYIENLQKHATNLDNELKKYKSFYNEHNETIQFAEERVNHAEAEIQRYMELYKNVLSELDERKIELLELKSKIKKH